ncbi:MAG: radical SAM protein [candidate division Zixibacteria bacterium]|nr:radical SAM protein [candidate division Zixibacteria bacterium]
MRYITAIALLVLSVGRSYAQMPVYTETDTTLASIKTLVPISDHLATSAQIATQHVKAIKEVGYQVLVNLAPANEKVNKEEGFSVVSAGLAYVHIPVDFKNPLLSVEITRECPQRCLGCYAFDPGHLGEAGPLESLTDYKGQALIDGMLKLVDRHKPLHVSIVGGEPLVRFRELDVILPELSRRNIEVLLVTSAVRPIPQTWRHIRRLHFAVSIDGLQPDHDVRRKPATYERILKHIQDIPIRVHCTITRQMTLRPGYFEEFVDFWSKKPEVRKIWFSLFTPQKGANDEEILPPAERVATLAELDRLRRIYPKIHPPQWVLEGLMYPPSSPEQCLFAQTTLCVTADLEQVVSPCQISGNPDCTQCGCIASAGVNAVADRRLPGGITVRTLYTGSSRVGKAVGRVLAGQRM